MYRLIAVLLLGCTLAALTGCSTIAGFGKDVEAVGGGVSAEPTKKR